ncbi:hypothetical protein DEO72_LG2g2224 [Vigna unguiculata]|uniref:Uncharacterized protein n=1 Tax=Vigna unguiculata TaxID=3917 RepID=A0A4D6KYL6_VIGUN|nr:hypothetical protein DEO72_LG2g2224 [Vigna unguiculata]
MPDDQDVFGWPNGLDELHWPYDINGLGGLDDPNKTNDSDEPGGLEDRDVLNRPDKQDESAGSMAQAGRASPTTHMGLAG